MAKGILNDLYLNLLEDGIDSKKIIKLYSGEAGEQKIAERMEADKKMVQECCHREPYVLKNGVKMFLPYYERGEIQQKHIHDTGEWHEQNELNYIFDTFQGGRIREQLSGKNALDIGANIGNHTLFMLKNTSVSCVHCFEPVEPTFLILENNIKVNNYQDRVCLYNIALGSLRGRVKTNLYLENNVGGTSFHTEVDEGAGMDTLDAMEIDNVAFIKIDVEGMEADVLLGARKTIEKFRPFVFIESFDKNFYKVKMYFEEYGYKYEAVGRNHNYLFYPQK